MCETLYETRNVYILDSGAVSLLVSLLVSHHNITSQSCLVQLHRFKAACLGTPHRSNNTLKTS